MVLFRCSIPFIYKKDEEDPGQTFTSCALFTEASPFGEEKVQNPTGKKLWCPFLIKNTYRRNDDNTNTEWGECQCTAGSEAPTGAPTPDVPSCKLRVNQPVTKLTELATGLTVGDAGEACSFPFTYLSQSHSDCIDKVPGDEDLRYGWCITETG